MQAYTRRYATSMHAGASTAAVSHVGSGGELTRKHPPQPAATCADVSEFDIDDPQPKWPERVASLGGWGLDGNDRSRPVAVIRSDRFDQHLRRGYSARARFCFSRQKHFCSSYSVDYGTRSTRPVTPPCSNKACARAASANGIVCRAGALMRPRSNNSPSTATARLRDSPSRFSDE
jgi:hypothetical protein